MIPRVFALLPVFLAAAHAQGTSPSACVISFPDEGYQYDLGLLRDNSPFRFTNVFSKYIYSFCSNITLSTCHGSFGMSEKVTGTTNECVVNYGYLSTVTAKYATADPMQGVLLTVQGDTCPGGQFGGNYVTTFALMCDTSQAVQKVTQFTNDGQCTLSYTIGTPSGCPTRTLKTVPTLGAGWIVVIVILVSLGLYCGGGIIYKRQKFGASGMEALPHIDTCRTVGLYLSSVCPCFGGSSHSQLQEDGGYALVDDKVASLNDTNAGVYSRSDFR